MGKYKSRSIVDDGIRFDSLMEHRRYQDLLLLIKAGEIRDLHVHPKFLLQEKYFSHSQKKNIPAITYTADFSYIEDGTVVVEDVKGFKTAVFNLKRRMFEYYFPNIKFRVIGEV